MSFPLRAVRLLRGPCLLSVVCAPILHTSAASAKPTAEDHWAFQPVARPAPPEVENSEWVRNPIDTFVLSKLESCDWKPAAQAGWTQLLRRIYLDLTGLPPDADEQGAFLASPSHETLDAIVDSLLQRTSYGERWARHWLDVVRYAESNGYERDATKPFVWRYRDYVIRAFNRDKAFNRFIIEQLAGDEIPDSNAETLIATGFNRLGHWDDEPADPETDRFDQLDDLVSTTSAAFLGVTLGCARCHDHKFDPFTARDYYSMVAVFNPLTRPRNGRTELTLPVGSPEEVAALNARDRRITAIEKEISELKEKQNAPAKTDIATPSPPEDQTRIAKLERQVAGLRRRTPDLPQGYFLHEPNAAPSPTHLLIRGSPHNLGPEVAPAVPAILGGEESLSLAPAARTSGRRLALARWIAGKENPLTARVLVNRVWQQHFGAGIVRTPNDFGTLGDRPTHPELLDWLAHWFTHDANWSLKALHKLILTSGAYRMARKSNTDHSAEDPDNRFLWRLPYRRLEVEAIRDSMLAVSGQLNSEMYGPSVYPSVPRQALEGHSDPDKIWRPFDEQAASRRTIYAFIKRSMVVPMLEVLDLCESTQSSPQRMVTTVAPQALTLFNGDFANRQARHFADRLVRDVGRSPEQQVIRAYRLALCRAPTDSELNAMIEFLSSETRRVIDASPSQTDSPDGTSAGKPALEQMCRVILNLNEFVYPD